MDLTTIANYFQILLIMIALAMMFTKNNIKLVIYLFTFSLFSSSLYFFNKAPDVALAEVAIGSAIMPLIYIISISKQREFIVISHVDDEFINNIYGKGYILLNEFTDYYKLKLKISDYIKGNLKGILRISNVDLIIDVKGSGDQKVYLLKGKKSSLLLTKLEQMTENEPSIEVVKIEDGETDD